MLAGMTASAGNAERNVFLEDANLQALLRRRAPWLTEEDAARLSELGAWTAGTFEEQADYTDRFAPPVLETADEDGRPRTTVRRNPLYAAVHRGIYERGIVGLNYGPAPRPFALTFAMGYLLSQSDISIHCPATLTGAVAYVLDRFAPEAVRRAWLPDLTRMDGAALRVSLSLSLSLTHPRASLSDAARLLSGISSPTNRTRRPVPWSRWRHAQSLPNPLRHRPPKWHCPYCPHLPRP